jgi:branched-chain amino acid transport system permease protein
MKRDWTLFALFVVVALAYPLVFDSNFAINVGVLILFAAFVGQSWNIAGGYAGQLSFGHVVFFGTGAYAATILQLTLGLNPWLGIPVAAVAGALVGALIAVLSFRAGLRGSYFALITLAFAEAFRILANSVEFTGGGKGLLIPLKRGAENFQLERIGFYYVILVLCAASILIAIWLTRSRFGARLAAIRENEDAAEALGINTYREKVRVMMLSGAMSGIGGVFYAQYYLYIDPPIAYGVEKSVEMLLVSMIGGAGTVFGPLIGSIVLTFISEITRETTSAQGLGLIFYGVLLVAIVAFLPDGLVQLFRRRRAKAA